MPASIPVTTPVVDIVATAVLLLVHAPPPVVLLKVMLCPRHTVDEPVIVTGKPLTVTADVTVQPDPNE